MNIEPFAPFPTILSPVEPEEPLPGLLWRNSIVCGRKRMKDHTLRMMERVALQPPWIVPGNLEFLFKSLSPTFGSVDEMVCNHTCLPAFLPFVEPENIPRVLGHVLRGESHSGIPSMLGLAGKFVNSKPEMAFCPDCSREDEARLGFTFWRRAHCLPGLAYCAIHRRRLVAGCRQCTFSMRSARSPRLPETLCWCGQLHVEVPGPTEKNDVDVLVELCTLAQKMLEGGLAGRTRDEIGSYLYWKAREAGYRNGTRLKTLLIAAGMRKRYSPKLLHHLSADLPTTPRIWVEKDLGSRSPSVVLTRNLLLFHFFGGALPTEKEFSAATRCEEAMLIRRDKHREKDRRSQSGYDREDCRRKILEHIKAHPEAGREDLLRALGRTAANARTFDLEWYEANLPASRWGQDPWSAERRELTSVDVDERASTHVLAKHAAMMAARGKPKQITRRTLLLECPRGNDIDDDRLASMPLTRAALTRCVEKRSDFQRRYCIWILLTTPKHINRHVQAVSRTGLTHEEVAEITAELIPKRFS